MIYRRNMLSAKSTVLFCLMILAMLVPLVACGGSPTTEASSPSPTATGNNTSPAATTASSGTVTVMMTTDSSGSFVFSPKTLTIKLGTTVDWKNATQAPHTVTSLDNKKSFNSGDSNPINTNMTFSFKFTTAGTFHYRCNFHPQTMQATIIVQ